MKITVIIPVYRVEKYIATAVQSVLAQTYKNWELLIVDDGSPDASVAICQQLNHPNINIIRQPNRGVSAARNTGIRHAKGDTIAFLDGDDVWLPDKLAKHVAHLQSSPHVGVSFSRSAFIDPLGRSLGLYQISKLKAIAPAYILYRNPIGNGSSPVLRREVLDAIKYTPKSNDQTHDCYFDEQLHHIEDIECWLRIALQTPWKIEGIPEALTLYRVNDTGASTNAQRQLESLEKVLEKTRLYAPEFVAQWQRPARAYQLRFLARRAVRAQAAANAVKFVHQALSTHWRIILEEPRRTLLTLAAAYSLWFLPHATYDHLETFALKITGANQKRRLQQSK